MSETEKTCFDAYREGREAGERAGFADAVREFMRPDGTFDIEGLRRRQRNLTRETSKTGFDVAKMERMREAYSRLIKIGEGSTCEPFSNGDTVMSMRGKIRREFLADDRKPNSLRTLERFKTNMWFDLRKLQIRSDGDMARFGKELVEEGLARLPFDVCVFCFPFMTAKGERISANYLLSQDDKRIQFEGCFFFGSGKPVGMCGMDNVDAPEAVYYALAVLASRQTLKTPRAMNGMNAPASSRANDSYIEVTISLHRPELRIGNGTHASPRLHWRRGHIRRLPDRTTWVRPTLVGADDGGTVLHDYRVSG